MPTALSMRLGDVIADISAGVSLHGENRLPGPEEVGILTLSALLGTRLDHTACKAITVDAIPKLGPSIRAGTILMSRSNTPKLVGSCVYVEEDIPDRYLPDLIWEIKVRPDAPCDSRWLIEYFRSTVGRRNLQRAAAGTSGTMIKLSMDRLRNLRIKVPPLDVQRAMVSSSSHLDGMVAKVSLLANVKQTLMRSLMQQLLTGEVRFAEFKDRSWEEVRLGDVFDERNETNRPDLPLLSVTSNRGVIPRDELDKRDTSNPDKSKYKRVAAGDIAYNTMRMWQGVSALSSLEGFVSPAYTVTVPTGRIHGRFAKHLFKFPPVVHLFHRHSQGLVDDTLNLKFDRFAKIKLTIPIDVSEQERIARVLDLCEAEIELLYALRRQYEAHKRALRSRLLSGDIAVTSP